jgi:hypothetical protein
LARYDRINPDLRSVEKIGEKPENENFIIFNQKKYT